MFISGARLTPNPDIDMAYYLYNKLRLAGYCIYGDRYFVYRQIDPIYPQSILRASVQANADLPTPVLITVEAAV